MKCSKCNNRIAEGQEVCLNCGHILGYESELSKKCIHCNREIPIAYKKCPYCKKKQKKKRYVLKILLIIFIMIIDWLILTTLYSSESFIVKKDYKEKCKVVSYEKLVREYNKYNGELVTLTGNVKSVNKTGVLFNIITISISVDNKDYEVIFNNKNNIGIIDGDEITIYGKYIKLKGNTPVISAKYIIIKNTD